MREISRNCKNLVMRSSQLELTPLLKKITISPLLIVLLFDQIVVVKTSLEGNFITIFPAVCDFTCLDPLSVIGNVD